MSAKSSAFNSKDKAKIVEAFAAKESSTVDDILNLMQRLETGVVDVSAAAAPAPKAKAFRAKKARSSSKAEKMLQDAISTAPKKPAKAKEAPKKAPAKAAAEPRDMIQCKECGEYFGSLARHLGSAHGMSADEYRKKYKIPEGTPLTAEAQKAKAAPSAAPQQGADKPAVPLEQAVTDDLVTCLECGKSMKMLKRHLGSAHSLTPEQYREKWDLPDDFPVTAPKYSESKSHYAKEIGLGEADSPIAPKRRGRKKKSEKS